MITNNILGEQQLEEKIDVHKERDGKGEGREIYSDNST